MATVAYAQGRGFYWYRPSSAERGVEWKNTAAEGRYWRTESEAMADCKAHILSEMTK